MLILTALLMVALLIVANSFYVAAEFSSIAVRKSKLQQHAEEGHRLAQRLLEIVANPEELDRYIAAAQIGITLASLMLGAYGEAQLAPILAPLFRTLGGMSEAAAESSAAALILIGLSIAQMILGELVPKSIAMQFADRTAFITAMPMAWSMRLFRPFIWLLNGSGTLLLQLFGISHGQRHVHSPEEIRSLIAESTEGGLIAPEERRRLNRALELGGLCARDIMVPAERIISIDVDAPVEELFEMIATSPFTRIPVRKGSVKTVVGIVHTKDVTLRLMEDRPPSSVHEVMRSVLSINHDVGADRVLALLREHHRQQALVTDKGTVVGLIGLEDILTQVFGRLPDEFKSGSSRGPRR